MESTAFSQKTADQTLFREAMSRFAAGVTIVTTNGPEGRHGLTATAVCTVSDDPPTMLVCINRERGLSAAFKAHGCLSINMLGADQIEVAEVFAGMTKVPMAERFFTGEWIEGLRGVPVLADALTSVQGRVVKVEEIATHSVLFVEVERITLGDVTEALLYHGRTFCMPETLQLAEIKA